MAIYSLKHRIFIVKRYYQTGNSIEKVQKEFVHQFDQDNEPTDEHIVKLVQCFESFGSVLLNIEAHSKLEGVAEDSAFNSLDIKTDVHNLGTETISKTKYNATVDIDRDICDIQVKMTENEEIIKKTFSCEQCDRKFTTKSAYAKHDRKCHKKLDTMKDRMATNREDGLYPCSDCDSLFKNKVSLVNHLNSTHSDEKPFSCNICKKSFKIRQRLLDHKRTHLPDKERPKKCEICGKGFIRQYALKLHIRTHTGEKHTICSICGQPLSSNRALIFHMRTHTGEKPHECTFCDKKFATPLNLSVHKRTHTGERPYICTICGKSFITNSFLKAHTETVHDKSKNKSYQCPFCPNKYHSSTSLVVHKRIHTGERPYQCQHCSKDFYDSATLRKHVLTHTGEKPYLCTVCNKTFRQLGHLRTHMKNVHKQL